MVQGNFSMEVVVIYNKTDGKIVRVCSLPAHLVGKKLNQDINRMFPDTDTSNLGMVIVKGKQYLEIERFKVITENDGEFVDIVEKVDKLSHFEEGAHHRSVQD